VIGTSRTAPVKSAGAAQQGGEASIVEGAPAAWREAQGADGWLDRLPAAAAVLGVDGAVLEHNQEAAELFGWVRGSAVRLAGARSAWFRALYAEAHARGSARALITRRHGGRRAAVEIRASPAEGGTLLAILRDCSAQLEARRARAAGERRLRAFLDRLPEPVIIEQEGRIAYANDAAARLAGGDVARELVGRPMETLLPAHDHELLDEIARHDHGGAEPLETSVRRGAGSTLVQVSALAIQYRRRPAVQLLLRDVTAQRQVEAGLRATHERLRLITDVVREYAILTVDEQGAIVSWNSGAERLTGYAAEDAVRAPFTMLHEGGTDVAAMLDAARQSGRHEVEATLQRADGTTFPAHVTITALQDPARRTTAYAVILRDLTERMRAEENLRRSEEQLRHAQKMDAVGRLAAGLAHDFNNVLTAIQGHVQFLLEDLPADLPSRDDAVEIRRAADRATDLTRQLLTFARRQPSRPVPLDLSSVVRDVEKLLRRLIRADVRLETVLQDGPPVFADPGQMEQVLVNLVVNARDAMPQGGTITVAVTPVRLDETFTARGIDLAAGDYVQLAVSDNGIGMTADVQRQVFEPFFTTKQEGTGLGLSTVYGIVQQSGGHISVYSEPGVGTTFKVFLPVHGEAGVMADAAEAAEPRVATVLLVEDDDAVRALALRALQAAGFTVITAADGEEALRKAGVVHRLDVVLTDLMMPQMRGDDVSRRIRALHPQAGVVLMSGFSQDTLVREGRIEADGHFLEKPFTPANLVRTVRGAMQAD